MATVFDFTDYKEFLRTVIKENSETRGYQAMVANAASCQASYLSQVLSGKADLLPDHAAGIAEFLGLTETDSEFFLNLVLLGRASSRALKRMLEKKIAAIKTAQAKISHRIANESQMNSEMEKIYYSSWYWSAIHISTSVPDLQTVNALAQKLSLPAVKISNCLEQMEKWGFVKKRKGCWHYAGGAAHLDVESTMTELNHSHWRQRALMDVQSANEASLHYTSVVSMAKKDIVLLRQFLLETVASSRKISDPSSPEEVVCFNLDLFQV